MTPEALVSAALDQGRDGVAVTDHNTMAAYEAVRSAAPPDFVIVPGEEIDTEAGQIIGLFLEDTIEPWQTPLSVLDEIHAQGGGAYAPHPFDPLRAALKNPGNHTGTLDAFEVRNSRCVRQQYNERATRFANRHGLPGTGGSDAHFAREVGRTYTRVDADLEATPEQTRAQVQDAIKDNRIEAAGQVGTIIEHAGTKLVKYYNRWLS
jgi:predicted metal-dependent phosphoesterase TrpH